MSIIFFLLYYILLVIESLDGQLHNYSIWLPDTRQFQSILYMYIEVLADMLLVY
jgi:hypothetical protein